MAYLNQNNTYTTKRIVCPVTGKGRTKTFPSLGQAQAWEELALAARAEGRELPDALGPTMDRTLESVVRRLLDEFYRYKTKATYGTARGTLNRLMVLWGKQSPISTVLTSENVSRFLADLMDQGRSASYVNSFNQYFRKLSEYCHKWGYIEKPIDVPPTLKRERTKFEWCTMDEVDQLVNQMPKRYGPLVRFINATGLRITEALTITHRDLEDGRVRVLGKGVKLRYVPLSETAQQALSAVPKGEGPVFNINYQSLAYAMKVASVRCGFIPTVTPHTLRHSFASRLAQKGVDIVKLQELMGHADISMTRRYMHLHPDWMDEVHDLLD